MKYIVTISRILLGLIFVVFGLNGFLHFIPTNQFRGVAGQFIGAIFTLHFYTVVFLTQIVSGLLISPRQLEHREWVCAVGLNSDSERVLRYASHAAKGIGANLTLVHVIPASGPDLPVQLDFEERVESAAREAASHRIEELQSAVGSHARVKIAVGPMKDTLTDTARRLRADVLVMGRSPQSGVLGRLRDLSYALIRDAPCPVLSV